MLATRLLALLATLLIACHALASELRTAQLPVPGRYIVVLKDAQDYPAEHQRRGQVDVASTAAELAAVHGLKVDLQFQHALRGFAVSDAKRSTIEALLKDPRVSWIEEDGEVFAFQTTQPNATWGLDRIDQRDLPLNGNYVYNTTASNVRAYIIDTGIRASHNEFGGRVLSGYTAINDGQGSNDCNGHGTHVAGTVGGSVYGVAKQARLVPVRVLNCQGSGTNSGVIAGIDWVAANHVKPAVANMSLGGGASSAVDTAVNNLINAGVTVVVAAGNENQDACNVSPARVANAVTVGSTTSTDARSSFSNWGTCVNIFAPGSSITAAWHTSDSATNTISGTSMASPHVAGVAALYLAANPSATPATVRNALYSTASQGKLTSIGTGSPNLLVYSLLTGGGGGGGGGGDPCTGCTKYTGSLSGTGASQIQPNGTYYYAAAGRHEGWLRGPSNADFDLELYRWNGSSWTRVARSAGTTSSEYISYNGTAGYYYWRIFSYQGSGSYEFWLKRP